VRFLLRLCQLGCLAFLVAAGCLFWLGYTLLRPGQPGKPVVFQVPEGASGSVIAAELEKKHLIHSGLAFRLLLRHHPKQGQLRAGYFRIEPKWSSLELYGHLLKDPPLSKRATFPEGLTLPEIAVILQRAGVLGGTAGLLEKARTQGTSFGAIFPADLEGYLYPETYDFGWDATEQSVLERMTREFSAVVTPMWEKRQAKSPLKSLREVVILASLVEREAQVDSERGLIAGVYINRLDKGMPLQCDATIQYALGRPKALLTYEDLKLPSPYNTYLHAGLPPGPISSVGKKSLQAAMSPTPSDYLYYVRNDLKGDGSHVFTRSYSEHLDACRRYQK